MTKLILPILIEGMSDVQNNHQHIPRKPWFYHFLLIEGMSDVQRQAGDGSSSKAKAAGGESTPWQPTRIQSFKTDQK